MWSSRRPARFRVTTATEYNHQKRMRPKLKQVKVERGPVDRGVPPRVDTMVEYRPRAGTARSLKPTQTQHSSGSKAGQTTEEPIHMTPTSERCPK